VACSSGACAVVFRARDRRRSGFSLIADAMVAAAASVVAQAMEKLPI
jgi:hypothetical protein